MNTRGVFNSDNEIVAKNFGGRLEGGEWIFDDEKSKQNFERHLQNVENNFDGAKFSIGINDNSTAALSQRIKNFLAGTNTHNERTRKKIKDAPEKLSGYKIAAGHFEEELHTSAVRKINQFPRRQSRNGANFTNNLSKNFSPCKIWLNRLKKKSAEN